MKTAKRILALLLVLVLALSLAACNKGGGEDPTKNNDPDDPNAALEKKLKGVEKVKLDHVYKVEYLSAQMPKNGDNESHYIQQVQEAGGAIYLTGSYNIQTPSQEYPDSYDYEWGVEIFRLNADGSLERLRTFTQESVYDEENSRSTESYVNNVYVAPDGTFWYMLEQYTNDWSDPENYIWEQNSALVHAAADGTELLRIPTAELADPKNEGEYVYIQQLLFPANGNLLAQTGSGFIGLDQEGKVLFRSNLDQENAWINSLCATGSGRIVAGLYSYSQVDNSSAFALMEVDPNTGKMTELEDLGTANNMGNLYGGPGDTLIMGKNNGIDSYDLGSRQRTEILNWLNCDVNPNYVQTVVPLSDGRFFLCERNWRTGDTKLAYMSPVGESVEKYVMHFAALYLDENVTDAIISYNKQNDLFRIVFDDYSVYATEEDYQAGLKVLNQEIISGNIPDLFSMAGLPYDVYAGKGLLLDLKPLLQRDLNMEDYLQNVFKAVERDGKVCSIIPAFTVQTLIAKGSWAGKDMGWTMADLTKLVREHPEARLLASDYTRENALSTLLTGSMDAFIDPNTGKCSFDTGEFAQLLELVKSFPEEIDWEKLYGDDMYWETYDNQYREGKTLLLPGYVSNYSSIRNTYYQFDSDCTFIGYPGAGGSGAVINPNMEIAISGRTKLDDQCWDFLRYLLSEEYQSEIESWCFPVRLDALKAMEEAALNNNNNGGPIVYSTATGGGVVYEAAATAETEVYDETEAEVPADGETGEKDDSATDGVKDDGETTPGDMEPIPEPIDTGYEDWWSKPITQEMADQVTAVVTGAVQVYREQTEIMAIIMEEAGAFFAGQKSAQAVASVIQSRVSLYEAESR